MYTVKPMRQGAHANAGKARELSRAQPMNLTGLDPLVIIWMVPYKRIVNGDFGAETDHPADPASILAELPEGAPDSGPLGIPSGINGDFGGECGDPVNVPGAAS